jgi:two-component system cell cycle response regulator DivK
MRTPRTRQGSVRYGTTGERVEAKRILLVDDYPDALEMWGLYLRALGYDVLTADDGLMAVDIAVTMAPDVVVMDLELPGLSGCDAARRLRQDGRTATLPLIAATGYSHAKQLEQARMAGFDAIVVKPCDPALLVAEIERHLRQRGGPASASEAIGG